MEKRSKKVCIGEITSRFGRRTHPITREQGSFHNGVDIGCKVGTIILSPINAKVMEVYYHEFGGHTVILKDLANDDRYGFCHLQESSKEVGSIVNKGEPFARSGNSGRSSGPHLHFSYATGGKWINNKCHWFNYKDPSSKIVINE